MQTLRNESNDTEKHEKVIKTQYHLNSLERTFLFANAVILFLRQLFHLFFLWKWLPSLSVPATPLLNCIEEV